MFVFDAATKEEDKMTFFLPTLSKDIRIPEMTLGKANGSLARHLKEAKVCE